MGNTKNYKMIISYDGTRYYGWEHQPNTDMTIQGKLENVLSQMIGADVEVIGAGRTDAGVHAKGMAANVHMDTDMLENQICDYMNKYLPEDICVQEVRIASERFHSRYNAMGKTYCYTCYYGENKPVWKRRFVNCLDKKPDLELMRRAAKVLQGEHDFKNFSINPQMKKSTVRIVDRIDIKEENGYYSFSFHGNGFLQNMVRILTGTLLEAGYGKINTEDIIMALNSEERMKGGPTAPALGLCLEKVDY
mgnify:CR=1 FL=1